MTIHEFAAAGDIEGVARELRRGVDVDARDAIGKTPLMIAAQSAQAAPSMLQTLLEAGADPNAVLVDPPPPLLEIDENLLAESGFDVPALREALAKPPCERSVLSDAVKHASIEKIELLLAAGANPIYIDTYGYSILLSALHRHVCEPRSVRLALVRRLIAAGTALDAASSYGETAVNSASRQGDFELLKVLLDAGADPSPLEWTDLFFRVAYGEPAEVAEILAAHPNACQERDEWERTPFLLAVHAGRIEMASKLLDAGSDQSARGRGEQTALMFAISSDHPQMVQWLIERGADLHADDGMGQTPLALAAGNGATDCVRALLAAGADATRTDDGGYPVIRSAANREIAELLVAHGACWSDIESELRRAILGHSSETHEPRLSADCRAHLHRQFGRQNPERMNNVFWDTMVRCRQGAYWAKTQLGATSWELPAAWCFDRFGHSLTKLPDGRFVEIGGEHEDNYDPEFCIYNDVVVHHGDGTFDIFGYPEAVFPPTDFHTATLVGSSIIILGNLGYADRRIPGHTPVYRLSLKSFAIEPVACLGDSPGWLGKHRAALIDANIIEVRRGDICDGDDYLPNRDTFRLDLAAQRWTRVAADLQIAPPGDAAN